ncbi:MAG: hypothetical protein NTY22_02265 [Proteobacteria bacterium]|nr:hypothetical protein [Pseudomonadota bacterium]
MGDINTLKNILLFAVKNGCKEIRLSTGSLPLLTNNDGKTTYLNGILPVSSNLIEELRKRYMSGNRDENSSWDETVIMSVAEQEFLLMAVGDSLVFRYLPLVHPIDNMDKSLSSACYNSKGIIIVSSKLQEQRFLNSYSIASYIASNRKITMVIIEKNKLFSLKDLSSNIINIYKPETELDVLIRIADQISSECVLVPDCTSESAISLLENLSYNKLVVVGTTPQLAKEMDKSNVLHLITVSEDGMISTKTDPELKIYKDVITKNLRGYNHA